MEITTATAAAQDQTKLQGEFATAALRKALDTTVQQGEDLARMIDQAGGVGRNLDVKA